jgi:hypothetical protein
MKHIPETYTSAQSSSHPSAKWRIQMQALRSSHELLPSVILSLWSPCMHPTPSKWSQSLLCADPHKGRVRACDYDTRPFFFTCHHTARVRRTDALNKHYRIFFIFFNRREIVKAKPRKREGKDGYLWPDLEAGL